MELLYGVILSLLVCSACSFRFSGTAQHGQDAQDPEEEWGRMEKVISDKKAEALAPETKLLRAPSSSGPKSSQAKKTEYLAVSTSEDQKEAFKPEKGVRPLPGSLKNILLKATVPTIAPVKTRSQLVEVLCHVDRMYVRIRRDIFKSRDAFKSLKLGTCPVNQGTNDHYYFLYLLTNEHCGFKYENNADYRVTSNVIRYQPTSAVLREMPFVIAVQCNFPRLFHSYRAGFYPVLQGGSIFKVLQRRGSFALTLEDDSGKPITGVKTYTLGQPMYFAAKGFGRTGDVRLYVNKCFMTATKDSQSTSKHVVIDNHGCMVDSKISSESKFLASTSKVVQRFSVAALIFKDQLSTKSSTQQLYMHCELSVGTLTPTLTSKACNYDAGSNKWKELYGDDSVCTCESPCVPASSKASGRVISTQSWKVDVSKGKYEQLQPRMTFSDADTFTLEDPSMEEHKDFLNNWDHNY
ncbi:zona pellucida sperm-binding protein 3 [Cottoperca gobio]|uniref:Zona pellucida sperm-binding protein 3 n=1 Tax=Cottoperca gobio TaxID=56716 RepID=A0A6J2QMU5_COTGO|nr:zona pellucida sperm-binding protein 3-like [Cottoperca gobio]